MTRVMEFLKGYRAIRSSAETSINDSDALRERIR